MTSLKHYRLGCGESLQSAWLELERVVKSRSALRVNSKVRVLPKPRQEKKH